MLMLPATMRTPIVSGSGALVVSETAATVMNVQTANWRSG